MNVKNSMIKGFEWLISAQNQNGSFGKDPNTILHTTCLSLLSLELYAIKNLLSPLDDSYKYKVNVEKSLRYLLLNAHLSIRGVYFKEEDSQNCVSGLALAAICANKSPSKTIDLSGSALDKKTYKEVADLIVNYLSWTQEDNGGWTYKNDNIPESTTSQCISLGLNLAEDSTLNYNCIISDSLKEKLSNRINYIQNSCYMAEYSNSNRFSNVSRIGVLINEIYLCKDDLSSLRLDSAIKYMADNWYKDIILTSSIGKRIITDYQSIFSITQGLSMYNIHSITDSSNNNIDWIKDICNILTLQQSLDGFWSSKIFYDNKSNTKPILSTSFALLSLLNIIDYSYIQRAPSKIPFNNYINISENEVDCICDISKSIEIEGEIKVFAHKYSNHERDCIPDIIPGEGDDIGFTLIFGNYGSFNYKSNCNKPTVQDCLCINSPAKLRLVSLCIPTCFRLYDLNNNKVIEECDLFKGDILYNIQVQKFENCVWNSCFDLPCHSMYCISMLFQIEFCCCE